MTSSTSEPGGQASRDVLIVLTTATRRGAELEGVGLATELAKRGWRSRVVALTSGRGDLDDVDALGRNPLGHASLRDLRRLARSANVVVAYGSTTLPACAIALSGTGVPFIYRSIGDPGEWVRGPVHRLRTRAFYRRASHVVALWPGAAENIEELYSVSSERIGVIPNARDARRFTPPSAEQRNSARASWGIVDDRPVVACLGALSPEKQIDRAIFAASLLPAVHLLIAGDGNERARVEEWARSSPGNVTVIGAVEDPRTVLHAADVLLLSSRTEGMPGVVIEAGLCAVPTVAPPVGAVPVLIDHGRTGIIAAGDEPTEIAEGLTAALNSAKQLGQASRHKMSEFTWDRVAPQWVDVLDRVSKR